MFPLPFSSPYDARSESSIPAMHRHMVCAQQFCVPHSAYLTLLRDVAIGKHDNRKIPPLIIPSSFLLNACICSPQHQYSNLVHSFKEQLHPPLSYISLKACLRRPPGFYAVCACKSVQRRPLSHFGRPSPILFPTVTERDPTKIGQFSITNIELSLTSSATAHAQGTGQPQ